MLKRTNVNAVHINGIYNPSTDLNDAQCQNLHSNRLTPPPHDWV